MKVTIVRSVQGAVDAAEYDYQPAESAGKQRPMALDILLQAEATTMPDLAYRYGCRNGQCGVCTVNVNGVARLACRTKVRAGDTISAMQQLPQLADLVVKRDAINRQLTGRITAAEPAAETQTDQAYNNLNRCIECYACVEDCPLHQRNDLSAAQYSYGNPFTLLKLQQQRVNSAAPPAAQSAAVEYAQQLGLEQCTHCDGCRCGVGIDLVGDVIKPLLQAAEMQHDHWS